MNPVSEIFKMVGCFQFRTFSYLLFLFFIAANGCMDAVARSVGL